MNKALDSLPEDADLNRFPRFTKEIIMKLYQTGQLGLTTTRDANIIIQTVWFYIVAHFFTQIDKRLLRELKESNLKLEKDIEGWSLSYGLPPIWKTENTEICKFPWICFRLKVINLCFGRRSM